MEEERNERWKRGGKEGKERSKAGRWMDGKQITIERKKDRWKRGRQEGKNKERKMDVHGKVKVGWKEGKKEGREGIG